LKIYRYKQNNRISWGILKEDNLYPVKGSIFRRFQVKDNAVPISDVLLLPPVLPTKIVAIAANYKDHAKERGRPVPSEPMLFLKPPSSLIGPNDMIIYPDLSKRVDYEGELAVVMKKKAYMLSEDVPTSSYILGYTCFNDVTARDLQDKDKRFTRGKSFDTFGAIGPCIATDVIPERLKLKTFLNGKLRQSASTGNMIFSVPFLIRYISRIMTLMPGDVISTGTPAGVGPMNPGDRVDVQIEGIGILSNVVMKVR